MTEAEQSTEPESGGRGGTSVVEISEVVPRPLESVWGRLTTTEGVEALLGPGARLGGKGEPWRCDDGTHGVVRSYHPMEQVRVSWHADADAPASLVDLTLSPDDAGTRLNLRHEHLAGGAAPDELRQRWRTALKRLTEAP
jgi:uncharacterized protein YndB with AHSA1/START domain